MTKEYLKFGTAGLRGIMGSGNDKMNIPVVKRASQGLAAYLLRTYDNPSVVISYDSRNNSRAFAECAASVLAANDVKTFIFNEMMPVPVLSYAVKKLTCSAGIVITASHNPREYNGYKVYSCTGGQILDEEAAAIMKEIEAVDVPDGINYIEFEKALQGCCSIVDDSLYVEYLAAVEQVTEFSKENELSVVYTPLNGSGRKPVQDILGSCGFDVFTVPEQEFEDGNFPTCPYPNPEKHEVYKIAQGYAQQRNADIIIATDPDCDRVGAMVKAVAREVTASDCTEGEAAVYELLSGNDIGLLLFDYICRTSSDVKGRTVVSSIVSTPMLDRIAAAYGVNVERTLVGFKYIGQKIDELGDSFIFGFEESNGYLTGTYARDKDGAAGAKLICRMAAFYKAQGLTLMEVLDGIYEKYGSIVSQTVNFEIGSNEEREAVMVSVRDRQRLEDAFSDISGYADYKYPREDSELPPADVIRLDFEDSSRVIIRPSGTEPKIKIYISACGSNQVEGLGRAEELLEAFRNVIG